uniref:Endonuclease/exonuclease/phosphatase domain-containing protein n=1 Tax=Chromera velia CCMP2878 TaxID=1169474 RepID=A0A0G4I1D6_9ALVE|eukprot:Cvel_10081.t1-p1 / transcript=Cvel_10081.t1 / gene=Cvel_10081 / organism=Chromera_velia_CCMP2878 / gene_product=hypothetical protein / transcript_product=hypothetical protein / location=Cvel_scaffold600:29306-34697(-) / protein_length=391 / sequence_SO=supercontig / SO=protein_coding / is_pseudo=false
MAAAARVRDASVCFLLLNMNGVRSKEDNGSLSRWLAEKDPDLAIFTEVMDVKRDISCGRWKSKNFSHHLLLPPRDSGGVDGRGKNDEGSEEPDRPSFVRTSQCSKDVDHSGKDFIQICCDTNLIPLNGLTGEAGGESFVFPVSSHPQPGLTLKGGDDCACLHRTKLFDLKTSLRYDDHQKTPRLPSRRTLSFPVLNASRSLTLRHPKDAGRTSRDQTRSQTRKGTFPPSPSPKDKFPIPTPKNPPMPLQATPLLPIESERLSLPAEERCVKSDRRDYCTEYADHADHRIPFSFCFGKCFLISDGRAGVAIGSDNGRSLRVRLSDFGVLAVRGREVESGIDGNGDVIAFEGAAVCVTVDLGTLTVSVSVSLSVSVGFSAGSLFFFPLLYLPG